MRIRLSGRWMGACGLLAVALGLAPIAAPGQTRPGAEGAGLAGAPPGGEGYTLVFLGDTRPILLRLSIFVDGKTVTSASNDYAKKWFDYLDRNGDGVLSAEEAKYVPNLQTLQRMRVNGQLLAGRNNYAALTDLDADGDGKVSLEELKRHFDRAGYLPVLLVAANAGSSPFRAASEALFKHLDVKNEGKLSKDGVLKAAETLLRKLDTNDDEILQAEELDPQPGDDANLRLALANQLRALGDGPAPASFYLVRTRQADGKLGQLLLSHYDKNQDFKLSRSESGLDRETFDRLDTNGDGLLDADELAHWHQGRPDVSITVRLGRKGPVPAAVDARRIAAQPGVESKVVDGELHLALGDARVSLRAGGSTDLGVRLATSQIYLQQFRLADSQNKGYLTEADLAQQGRVFATLFPLIDRDGDGKMTLAEVTAFSNLVGEAGQGAITISVAEQGRTLFQLLDRDGDGRLSLRELRTAWERLAPLDKNGDGFVSADEIPRQFEVVVSQGPAFRGLRPVPVVSGRLVRPPVRVLPARGPLWFRKMDLNGDGDVSRREFLGTSEEFRQIDTNGDGLISVEEAEAYDARMRAAQKPPR
jgi:Ca2+-binding EF-hand superfamily protein